MIDNISYTHYILNYNSYNILTSFIIFGLEKTGILLTCMCLLGLTYVLSNLIYMKTSQDKTFNKIV